MLKALKISQHLNNAEAMEAYGELLQAFEQYQAAAEWALRRPCSGLRGSM